MNATPNSNATPDRAPKELDVVVDPGNRIGTVLEITQGNRVLVEYQHAPHVFSSEWWTLGELKVAE